MQREQTRLSPLEQLQARAVASSSDRVNWLAARVHGVTATEVAKLRKGGASARREIIAAKINGDSFKGNQYTEWGSQREAAIAEDVRARAAIAPNDVLFHAEGNQRHLATPDGVGADFDENVILSEIKTSKHDLMPSTGLAPFIEDILPANELSFYFWSTGYYDQVQWQIYVAGAARARFTWEQHDDDWSGWPERGPRPLLEGQLPFRIIERDPRRIKELIAIADEFLDAYDEALRNAADGVAPEIDEQLDTMAVNVLRFREEEASAKKAKEAEWAAMLERLEGCDALSVESALARVTYSPGEVTESTVPDVEAAKQADPDLFARVQALSVEWNAHQKQFAKVVETPGKPHLTVTGVKPKAVKK
jgi:hypothetical protein